MFNSLNNFKLDPQSMRAKQNSTVRNVAGFRNTGQNTLFSNSFIRDSVISTLKHNSKDGEKFSENSSEANVNNLTNPRLSTDKMHHSINQSNKQQAELYNKTLYPIRSGRKSSISRTSYFNQMIIDKEQPNKDSKASYYKERYRKQNVQAFN